MHIAKGERYNDANVTMVKAQVVLPSNCQFVSPHVRSVDGSAVGGFPFNNKMV